MIWQGVIPDVLQFGLTVNARHKELGDAERIDLGELADRTRQLVLPEVRTFDELRHYRLPDRGVGIGP